MSTILKTVIASLVLAAVITGCNTVKGAGEDVSDVGKGIERAVR